MQMNTRQISSIYRQLLYTKNLCPLNIGYTKTNTWYDFSLEDVSEQKWNFSSIENMLMNYQLYFINNPMLLVEFNHKLPPHAPKILFFHDSTMSLMKKEDLYILNDKTSGYKKYSFIPALKEFVQNLEILKYGFKKPEKNILTDNRDKTILFCCDKNNLNTIIFNNLKTIYPNSDVYFYDNNTVNINNILNKYKICINLSNYSYNTLLAASFGCSTMSLKSEEDIPNHKVIKNIDDIAENLKDLSSNFTTENCINNSDAICSVYPYDKFIDSIAKIIHQALNIEII